jgi:DNA-binding LacI/PurR family transcriptional regulator
MESPTRKLRDFEVTRVAAQAICRRETVRAYFQKPDRMKPATRARVEQALRELGFLSLITATSGAEAQRRNARGATSGGRP